MLPARRSFEKSASLEGGGRLTLLPVKKSEVKKMTSVKEQALDTVAQYMDKASEDEQKQFLVWLEGFSYHAQNAGKEDDS